MNDSQKGGARLMKSEHKRRELAPLLAIFGILVGLALASLLTPEREPKIPIDALRAIFCPEKQK